MCHKLAECIIVWCEKIYELDEYGHVKAVYGMEVFLENLWKLAGLLVIGNMVENKAQFFVSIISFSLLRIFAGGKHSKSSVICFLFMVSIGLFPVYIIKQMIIPIPMSILLFLIMLALVLVYAPCTSYVIHNAEERKVQASVLVVVYLIIFIIISDLRIRIAILFGALAEVMTLVEGVGSYGKKECR